MDAEEKRIYNACLRDRKYQQGLYDEKRTRDAVIEAYLSDEISREQAAELLVIRFNYGPQGAINALDWAAKHRPYTVL